MKGSYLQKRKKISQACERLANHINILLDISKENDGLKFQNKLLREREGEREGGGGVLV